MKTSLLANLKFFTALLSIFAMLNFSVGTVYAQAQEASDQPNLSEQRIQDSQANNPGSDPSKQDTQKLTRTQEINLDKTSQGMSDMIYFLVLIGMSLFVVSLWRFQPMTLDMKIAMGAAVVMLGSEIVSVFNTRSKIDAGTYKVETREDGTVNNMQLDALKKQRESYEQLRKHGEMKWKIQAAGAAAYTVAGTLAKIQAAKVPTEQGLCFEGLTVNVCPAALTLYSTTTGIFWTPQDSMIKAPELDAAVVAFADSFVACTGPTPPATAAAAGKAAFAACLPYLNTIKIEPKAVAPDPNNPTGFNNLKWFDKTSPLENFLFPVESMYVFHHSPVSPIDKNIKENFVEVGNYQTSHQLLMTDIFSSNSVFITHSRRSSEREDRETFSKKFLDLIIPSAEAFAINKLGVAASVITILIALYKGSYKWMDKLMINPKHRGTVFFATAAASGVAMMITRKSVGQAEDNIKKIDDMIERFERLQKMKVANLKNQMQSTALSGRLDPTELGDINIAGDGKKFPCPPTVGKKSEGCPSIEKDIKESPGVGDFGAVMGNLAGLSGKVADGFTGNSKLSAGTINDIESLSSNLAVAKRMARQAEDQINENRKKMGLPPENFEREKQALLKQIGADIQKELQRQNISNQGVAAAFNGSVSPEDANTQTAQEESTELVTTSVAAKGGANMDNVAAPVFDFSFEDEEFEEVPLEEEFAYSDEMYAKAFESQANSSDGGTSQIVGNRDVSLFKVISVRYMKSGLPRLLDELQELE